MDKRILNEIRRNKELMGLNEQGILDAVKRGIEKGKEFGKKLFNRKNNTDDLPSDTTTTNTNVPLETKELNNGVFFEIYPDYTWFIKENTSNNDEPTKRIIEESIKSMFDFNIDFTKYPTKYRNSNGKREVIIEIPSSVIEEFIKNKENGN